MALQSVLTVLARPYYMLMTVLIAVNVFVVGILIPHVGLLYTLLGSDSLSLLEKATFVVNLLGAINTNFTILSALVLGVTSILFGVNLALLVFYIKRARGVGIGQSSVTTISGFVSAVFGIGCAACGSLIATTVLVSLGAGGLITLLPLRGVEFGFIGIALLAYSIYLLSKKISAPLVCDIN